MAKSEKEIEIIIEGKDWEEALDKAFKKANKNAVIIGEIMHEANSFLKGDQLDGIMNYPFKNAIIDFSCRYGLPKIIKRLCRRC